MTRIFLTGGSGVLGRAVIPLLREAGHELTAPTHGELDLLDPAAVCAAVHGFDAVMHLATRIPSRHAQADADAWRENDALRAQGTRLLVDAALAGGVQQLTFPSIAFVYPVGGPVDETTPIADDVAVYARSALEAERQVARFAASGRAGVTLRLGLLYGPGTGSDSPAERFMAFGATLQIEDAAHALLRALDAPSGIYNVVADGERVSNARFTALTGWRPLHHTPTNETRQP